jgi:DNA gyrase subunit B
LKDDAALEEFIFESAQNGTRVTPKSRKTPIQGPDLIALLKKITRHQKALGKLSAHGKDPGILNAVAYQDNLTPDTLKNKKDVKRLIEELKVHIKAAETNPEAIEFSIEEDAEHGSHAIRCASTRDGIRTSTVIDGSFLSSPGFMELRSITRGLKETGEPPFKLSGDGVDMTIPTFRGLMDYVLELGKKGLNIQRYKGLGEMNPDQLWETTMDPEKRVLLQVRIEDEVEAENIFTKLMGDNVEPRRDFIIKHALEVSNLDV